ncbi:AAA domain-containing protein [Dactylosporangium sp. NPDC005555]|uniref:AAA domain-containing protein n=1 Tax=Dactylosporangium sp. NPDC005555 TaxID=3154889 RepID=UPI0033B9CF17
MRVGDPGPPALQPTPSAALRPWLDPDAGSNTDTPPRLIGVIPGGDTDVSRSLSTTSITALFEEYLGRWQDWAEQERFRAKVAEQHSFLEDLRRAAAQRADTHELIVGVGLIAAEDAGRSPIYRHLLTVDVGIEHDPDADALQVVMTDEVQLRLEDRKFLEASDGFSFNRSAPALAEPHRLRFHPFSPAAAAWLEEWKRHSWTGPLDITAAEWAAPDDTGASRLTLSPALLLRERDRSSVAEFYQHIADQLDRPDAAAPLGLAQLVLPLEPADRVRWLRRSTNPATTDGIQPLFPLAANREQQEILNHLRGDNGVVVQGPPGTGKTHTIANLTAALLADGQRVLITSEKERALHVLRDKLPPGLRELCVFMSGLQRRGAQQLEDSINDLSELVATVDPVRLDEEIVALDQQRQAVIEDLEEARQQLLFSRSQEHFVHRDVAVGYEGSLRDLVRAVEDDRASFAWITASQQPLAATAPLTDDEAVDLVSLLRTATPQRAERAIQELPDLRSVPSPMAITAAIGEVTAAERLFEPDHGHLRPAFMVLEHPARAELERLVEVAITALNECGLGERARDWGVGDWQSAAVEALLDRRTAPHWVPLLEDTVDLYRFEHLTVNRDGSTVDLDTAATTSLQRLLGQARRLRRHFARGGRLRRYWPPQAQIDAMDLLESCTVDGAAPASVAEVNLIIGLLEAEIAVADVANGWAQLGHPLVRGPLRHRLRQLCDRIPAITAIRAFITTRDMFEQKLRRHDIRYQISTPHAWDDIVMLVRAGASIARAKRAIIYLEQVGTTLADWAEAPRAAPEVTHLAAAVRDRDADRFGRLRRELDQASADQRAQLSCDVLLDRLRSAHPELAERITATVDDPIWDTRVTRFGAAWAWARAADYCTKLDATDPETTDEDRVEEHELRLRNITTDFAAKVALRHCATRLSAPQRRALQSYKGIINDLGRGGGKQHQNQRHLADARDAIQEAAPAIPAWIMPIDAVARTIPAIADSFDVVIVDEASQATIKSLFLLWLAPRVIIVGDENQCQPGNIEEHDSVQDLVDHYLGELPAHARAAFKPTSNLYRLMAGLFPHVVKLSQHFRCMPEIIGWSSGQFYKERLVPLRQFGADRLEPLKVVRVPNGKQTGDGQYAKNRAEAEAIFETVEKMVNDPDYAERSIGVIALQGTGQISVLEAEMRRRLDDRTINRHDIRVGQPQDFQGDERDVILLSMVVDRARKAITSRREGHRYNVAASRAKDQMWLFLSFDEPSTHDEDLRRSLLTYMKYPPAALTIDPILDHVPADRRRPPFRSLLQQQVFLELRACGYAVIPQYEISKDQVIDLLVVGDQRKLAIECDTPECPITSEHLEQRLRWEGELRRSGWQFHRMRHSLWASNQAAALEPLWQRLQQLRIEPRSLPATGSQQVRWTPVPLSDDGEADA